MQSIIKKSFFTLFLACSSFGIHAETINISVSDTGWYTKPGTHLSSIKNYYASEYIGQRNYFIFDLSSIDISTVNAASLKINSYNITHSGVFSLYDVTTPASSLSSQTIASIDGIAINKDLGDGKIYGSLSLNPSDSNQFITVNLNQNFIDDLKSSHGSISLGGTFFSESTENYFAFGTSFFNLNNVLSLEVTPVPEPSSALLFGAGITVASLARRYKSK